jgi:hypothetical protein
MNRKEISKALEDIGKQVSAWSYSLAALTDKEAAEILPRAIKRVVAKLEEISEECLPDVAHNLTKPFAEWRKGKGNE